MTGAFQPIKSLTGTPLMRLRPSSHYPYPSRFELTTYSIILMTMRRAVAICLLGFMAGAEVGVVERGSEEHALMSMDCTAMILLLEPLASLFMLVQRMFVLGPHYLMQPSPHMTRAFSWHAVLLLFLMMPRSMT